MARKPVIGMQDFSRLVERNYFYVDKTNFIKEWWEEGDNVTLITRPRRFGKTLTLSMVRQFFSIEYAGRGDLFDGLSIWEDEKFRKLQGTYPVISLSFLGVKFSDYEETKDALCGLLAELYNDHYFLMDSGLLTPPEKEYFSRVARGNLKKTDFLTVLRQFSKWLSRYYGQNVILLIDEYDTPMNEAYVSGYWDELTKLIRDLFTGALKGNPYLERALVTGITRISKESFFSELNNLKVVSVTSNKYETVFGFTEDEVLSSLQEFGLEDTMDQVKYWYDGFQFGGHSGIYNPWSIINYLDERKFSPYWVNVSSNDLPSVLVRRSSNSVKREMEDLLSGKSFKAVLDEQIVFNQLDKNETAIWSLLLASGYLKAVSVDGEVYELVLTNHEVVLSFRKMVREWFARNDSDYNAFVHALLRGDLDEMNSYMNNVTASVISSFDSGTKSSETLPERFYHGFVLGLLVELEGRYAVTSNRESGYGRYDVTLEPLRDGDDGIIMEFKVNDSRKENDLQDTVKSALKQITDKKYAAELAKKVPPEKIRMYGFAFAGKKVLIGGGYAVEQDCIITG